MRGEKDGEWHIKGPKLDINSKYSRKQAREKERKKKLAPARQLANLCFIFGVTGP